MNIKVASEKTGLTKKAIKYYENEGLISPVKNSENNYREYTEEDLIRLNLIGSMRILDIPVSSIKSVLQGNKALKDVFKDTLLTINENIKSLEKSKLVIENILKKDIDDYKEMTQDVKKLRQTLEFSAGEKKEYISEILLRIFPGNFGKLFVSVYEPFLNITIDSDVKKGAWLNLVEFLDNLNEADYENSILKGASDMDDLKIEEFRADARKQAKEYLSGDENLIEKHKQQMIKATQMLIEKFMENEEIKEKFINTIKQSRALLNDVGAPEDTFDKYLEILNEDYKRYKKIGEEINKSVEEETKKKFGFTLKEFWQQH